MLVAGPISGFLSDRFGARPFATAGMLGAAISFGLLLLLPTDFSYPLLRRRAALNGISMGMFASPNRAGVMNSLPAADRGAGGGMNQTFQNSAQVLSIGIFFTLMILGLASTLPDHAAGRPRRPTASSRHGGATSPTCRRSRSSSPPSSATTRSSTCSAPRRSPPSRRTTRPR